MTTEGEGATTVGARAASAWRAMVAPSTAPIWIAMILVLAVAIVLVAVGGLDAAESEPAAAPAGTRASTSLYAATALKAEVTDAVEVQFLEAEPGERLLVVTFLLENLSSQPIGVDRAADNIQSRLTTGGTPLISLPGALAGDAVRSWRTDGSPGVVILQPDVPAEVQIAWAVPDDAFPDGTALIDVHDARAQAGQVILSASAVTWRRTELVARVAVEIES